MAIGVLPVEPIFITGGSAGAGTDVAAALFGTVRLEADCALSIDSGCAFVTTVGGFILTISTTGIGVSI